MDNFEKPYRGRILPEVDGSIEKKTNTKKGIAQEADKILQRRERGRFVEGKFVSPEKRLEELEKHE